MCSSADRGCIALCIGTGLGTGDKKDQIDRSFTIKVEFKCIEGDSRTPLTIR